MKEFLSQQPFLRISPEHIIHKSFLSEITTGLKTEYIHAIEQPILLADAVYEYTLMKINKMQHMFKIPAKGMKN